MKRLIFSIMTVLCLSSLWGGQALAQSLAITGKVIDEAGEAVAGAGVVEKGSLNGTVTDVDGNFSMTVSSGNAVLEVSFIGFKTAAVPVNGQAKLTVYLALMKNFSTKCLSSVTVL